LEALNTLSVIISFPDGSIGSINYLSNGDPRLPKERVEIFGGGSVCLIDDFKHSEIIHNGKLRKFSGQQDKGHDSEFQAFVKAVCNNEPIPVDFREYIAATICTFKIIESQKSGNTEEMKIEY